MVCKHIALLFQKNLLPVIVICFFCQGSAAQQIKPQPKQQIIVAPATPVYIRDHDTSYYESFDRYITTRFYFSKKFASLELEKPSAETPRFRYIPNTSLTMGVGVTYQSISLNLGYGFGFLNPDQNKGKTRYLDLQSHIYGREWVVDLLGQFYKGYYLASKGFAAPADKYYLRPDLRIQLLGISAYRLMNPTKFSYRAALLQSEKQKKSAGSLLIGGDVYYGIIKADSSLVPTQVESNYGQKGVRRLDFLKIGPGIGYAYTVVIKQTFFFTGSLSGNLSVEYTRQHGVDGRADRVSLNPGFTYRLVAGYDNNNWNINMSLVGNQFKVTAATSDDKYLLSAGNFRLTFAKRIKPGKSLSQKLQHFDRVIEGVRGTR